MSMEKRSLPIMELSWYKDLLAVVYPRLQELGNAAFNGDYYIT